MSAIDVEKTRAPVILSLAFRPFFLAAGLWASFAVAVWLALLAAKIDLPSRFDPLAWHIHEMLFGFVPAAIAGFILTAIANWTGRPPVRGPLLASLVILWLLGRIACFVSALMPLWLATAIDLLFLLALFATAVHEIAVSRNWRNLAMPMPIAALAIANLLMHLELAGFSIPIGLGWRLGLSAIIVLISVVGGRIIPTFTRNWLIKNRIANLPAPTGPVDRVALGLLHAGLIGWAFFPTLGVFGLLLVVAAAFNLVRLLRWRGYATASEPLLAILHLGYLWLVLGTALLGAAMLTPSISNPAAIHAFTVGAVGVMVLAVMTRVSLGHTSRPLTGDHATIAIYVIANAAAIARVAAAFMPASSISLLNLAAALWISSFLLFVFCYGRMLVVVRNE